MSENEWPEIAPAIRKFGNLRYREFGFDRSFFEELSTWIGCPKDEDTIRSLREPHYFALQRYYYGQDELLRQVKREDEDNALTELKRCADALSFALDDLGGIGLSKTKFLESIKTHPRNIDASASYLLADLLGHPEVEPFKGLEALLRDISVAAERAIPRKPIVGKAEPLVPYPMPDRAIIRDNFTKHIARNSFEEIPQKVFEDQKAAGRLTQDFPVLSFLVEFKKLWLAHSPHTFTEGKPHSGEGYISHAVIRT